MLLNSETFFPPSKTSRTFAILQALSEDTCTTQKALAEKARISGAMVNQYIKDFQDRGWLMMSAINGKSYSYELTADGDRQRLLLQSQYLQELTEMYSGLKDRIQARLEPACNGSSSIAIFGVNELCDLIFAVLKNTTHSHIRAIVDQDPGKQGRPYFDHIISPPEVLAVLAVDVIIVSSMHERQTALSDIVKLRPGNNVKIISF